LQKQTEESSWPLCQEHHEHVTEHREGALEKLQEGAALVLGFYRNGGM
jgi:hypothetical protein